MSNNEFNKVPLINNHLIHAARLPIICTQLYDSWIPTHSILTVNLEITIDF